jgi:hypothetical protein
MNRGNRRPRVALLRCAARSYTKAAPQARIGEQTANGTCELVWRTGRDEKSISAILNHIEDAAHPGTGHRICAGHSLQ